MQVLCISLKLYSWEMPRMFLIFKPSFTKKIVLVILEQSLKVFMMLNFSQQLLWNVLMKTQFRITLWILNLNFLTFSFLGDILGITFFCESTKDSSTVPRFAEQNLALNFTDQLELFLCIFCWNDRVSFVRGKEHCQPCCNCRFLFHFCSHFYCSKITRQTGKFVVV